MGILKDIWNTIFGKSKTINNTIVKPKKNKKFYIGQLTKIEIKEYIDKNGSLDVYTCEKLFKVKSLRNFISDYRKEGFIFERSKITICNDLGENINVTKYTLIS